MSKPFYVYVLKDDAGTPFYVLKGAVRRGARVPRTVSHARPQPAFQSA